VILDFGFGILDTRKSDRDSDRDRKQIILDLRFWIEAETNHEAFAASNAIQASFNLEVEPKESKLYCSIFATQV